MVKIRSPYYLHRQKIVTALTKVIKKPTQRKQSTLEKLTGDKGKTLLQREIKKLLFPGITIQSIKKLNRTINSKHGLPIFRLTNGERNLTNIADEAEIESKNAIAEVKRSSEKFREIGLFILSEYKRRPAIIYEKNYKEYPNLIPVIEGICNNIARESILKSAEKEMKKVGGTGVNEED